MNKPSRSLTQYHWHPRHRLGLFAGLLLLLVLAGSWQWQQGARIQSDILAMLPQVDEQPLTQAAIERVESQLENRVYFALTASNAPQAVDAAQRFMDALATQSGFSEIKSADFDNASALNEFYFKHRFKLLTDTQLADYQQQGISAWVTQAQQQLYSAFGVASSALLSQDPLLLYPDNLMALAPTSKLQLQAGILLTDTPTGQVAAMVSAKGQGSAFNPQAQALQLASIDYAKAQLDESINVVGAGALFHAAHATAQAKTEISTLGLASLIGVIALVYLAFRSVVPLIVASLTLASSFVFAFVTTLLLFGEVHLLTLVFGTSLIGVAIDYCFHFYCERLNQNNHDAAQAIKAIFPAISLALLTTVLAYVAIGFTPFPGMQQVASFCGAGLIGAYLTLLLAYPSLAGGALPNRSAPLNRASAYLAYIEQHCQRLSASQRRLLLLLVVIACGMSLSQLRSNDDIRALQSVEPQVMAAENQVRQLLSGGTDNQFVLVAANDKQQLLTRLAELDLVLDDAQHQGWIGNHVSLAQFIPPHVQQDRNYQAQQALYSQLPQVLAQLGMSADLAEPLQQQFALAKHKYIEPEAFMTTPMGQLLAPLWLAPSPAHPNQYGAIMLLGGITDLNAVSDSVAQIDRAIVVDKVADISSVMGHYRQLTLNLLAIALAVAAIIFCWRFGLRKGLLVVAVPLLAIVICLSILALAGIALSLFHALALILVFGIGVDYALFFAESKHQNSVMMAVAMSACSTMLAFGLLAFSQTPAIHAFGLTLLLGIALTFMLSPLPHTFARNLK
ncbi:MMPL family transporter [Shewanella sp. Scap07]|uniref:MMPL family transporter n=1 Tax=Shewanella sp. Scap07 TaxID=2589987 RepID=UPI0015B8E50A|nr:MMPL family transporter [Shewanella sp. Scap07]QLE87291.1 MMPL family transporter [Shewanella sp. Scap07]